MKFYFLLLVFVIMSGCSKPKTVLICGDHVCINKAEAEQFFEENLTIEVKVIDSKEPKKVDLVEINLESNQESKKRISVTNKKQTKGRRNIMQGQTKRPHSVNHWSPAEHTAAAELNR